MEVSVEEAVTKFFDKTEDSTVRLKAQQLALDGSVGLFEQSELLVAGVLVDALLVSHFVHLLSDELEQDAQAGGELLLVVGAL